MKSLTNRTDLFFSGADKGGGLVIMDYSFYKSRMMQEHLMDSSIYTKIDNYNMYSTTTQIKTFCKSYSDSFSKRELTFLTKFHPRMAYLYGLPKLHKHENFFKNIKPDDYEYIKVTAPNDLKFRPIIASKFAPTSNLSAFLDEILKFMIPLVGSYCRDTFHFLENLPNHIEPNSLLISYDVISLYTNITHELGYEAIAFWLEKCQNNLPSRFKKSFIMDGLKLVLENNYFTFENDTYLQIKGTAMGTKVAPTYATLVMGFLEERMYIKLLEIKPNVAEDIITSWTRFLDDCFVIWRSEYGTAEILDDILNDLDNSIKFTKEASKTSLNFLDVTVYVGQDNKIHTDIFRKHTDTMSYVPFTSAHPYHVLKNIPYTLARRVRTIVSEENVRHKRYDELKDRLIQLKYPISLIDDAIKTANENTNRQELRESNTVKIPFIHEYNKNNPNIYQQVISPASNLIKNIEPFRNSQFIKSFRQPKSLLNILSNRNRESVYGVRRCGEPRCKCCNLIITGDHIEFKTPAGNTTFQIKQNLDCRSQNVIYKLVCAGCDQYYIGQSGDSFRNRMTIHRQQIQNESYTILKMSRHIASCAGGQFRATPFFQLNPNANRNDREMKEAMFIKKFSPSLNVL